MSSTQLTIAPKPIQRQLNLRFAINENSDILIRIIDNNGRIVYTQNIKNTKFINKTINISGYQKGLYYIQTGTPKELKTLKFIKE